MSKPWGAAAAGAWALDAERAEAEERELAASAPPPQSFPSLKEAAASKSKKKKSVPIPLAQFVADPQIGFSSGELLRLPTGPRERGPDELEQRRGFTSYDRPRRGIDDEPRRGPPPSRVSDIDLPSRADEVDNWARGKKQLAPMDSGRRHDRYASLGGSSRADEVDSWARGKKQVQSIGLGFRGSFNGGPLDLSNGERKRLVLDPPKKERESGNESVRSQARPSPFGAARPREEVLADKGLDWKKIDLEIECKKLSRPTSSHSSRPSSAQSSRPGSSGVKVNPFGDAKPREVLLQEKGMDWRKIDLELEHRGVDRPETDEEKLLKEEIDHLKSHEENAKSESSRVSADVLAVLHEEIVHKEKELEILIRQLDDKVRFGQRASGSMRPTSRPQSRSGVSEESRGSEFMERPRSRGGMANPWVKPTNERRGFQSGYFGDRNMERPNSRERW